MKFKSNIDKVTPPIMEYRLPSGGIFYKLPNDAPFPKTVRIRPFGFDTEAILVSNLQSSEKMAKIIGKVTELPDHFDPADLMEADQFFILSVTRALTYEENYAFSTTCPKCGTVEKHSLKIPDQLPIRLWTNSPEDTGPEYVNVSAFRFQLPVVKDTIEIKYISLRETYQIQKYNEEKSSLAIDQSRGDHGYLQRLAHHIRAINGTLIGNADYEELIRDYLLKLVGKDFVALSSAIEDNNCGLLQKWDLSCDNCGAKYTARIPLDYNFFR